MDVVPNLSEAAELVGIQRQNIEWHLNDDEEPIGISFYALTEAQCLMLLDIITTLDAMLINCTNVKDDGGGDWPYSIHIGET